MSDPNPFDVHSTDSQELLDRVEGIIEHYRSGLITEQELAYGILQAALAHPAIRVNQGNPT